MATTEDLDRDIKRNTEASRRNTQANWLNLLIGCVAVVLAIAGFIYNHQAIRACLHD